MSWSAWPIACPVALSSNRQLPNGHQPKPQNLPLTIYPKLETK
jgi:hypothetical protein